MESDQDSDDEENGESEMDSDSDDDKLVGKKALRAQITQEKQIRQKE